MTEAPMPFDGVIDCKEVYHWYMWVMVFFEFNDKGLPSNGECQY